MKRRLERSEWFANRKLLLGHERDEVDVYRGCWRNRTGWSVFGQEFVSKLDFYMMEFFDFDPYYNKEMMDQLVRDIELACSNGRRGILKWIDENVPETVSGASYAGRSSFADAVRFAFLAT